MHYRVAQHILAAEGMSLRHNDGEYRVNFRNGTEDSAYYTNDLQDAVDTGRSMAAGYTDASLMQTRPDPNYPE